MCTIDITSSFANLAGGISLLSGLAGIIGKCPWATTSPKTNCVLCSDERYVALKIVKSAAHYTETAMDEIELLKRVHSTLHHCSQYITSLFTVHYIIVHSTLHHCSLYITSLFTAHYIVIRPFQ